MTKFAFRCACGGKMTGEVEPSENAHHFEAIFWEVHTGPSCTDLAVAHDRVAAMSSALVACEHHGLVPEAHEACAKAVVEAYEEGR